MPLVNIPLPKISVGFVGAGRRVQTLYFPMLKKLPSIKVTGFTQRTKEKGRDTSKRTQIPFFQTVEELVQTTKPDFLIVCVPPIETVNAANTVMKTDVPFLIETPIALSLKKAKKFLHSVRSYRLPVGVLEQKPFLPIEQFKHMILDLNILGKIVLIENDFFSYDYHAIAQLRRYIGKETIPVYVSGFSRVSRMPQYTDKERQYKNKRKEIWDIGVVAFENDVLLLHTMTSIYKTAPIRPIKSLRIYGERGVIVNTQVSNIGRNGRIYENKCIVSNFSDGTTKSISLSTEDGNIRWDNPFLGVTLIDEEIAILQHLQAVALAIRGQGNVLYSINDAFCDLQIMEAIRASANRDGMRITVKNGIPSYWRNIFHFRWLRNSIAKMYY